MASAAAVGADAARSPIRNTIGEDDGLPGQITSAIGSKEELGIEEDEDDDIRSTTKRRAPAGDEDGAGGDVGDADLFGEDEDEEAAEPPAKRLLDDSELDSGDDVDRTDRIGDQPPAATQEQEYELQERTTMDLEISRQALPEPSDGEMYLMKMPDFLAIEPQSWSHAQFQPPTTDHHSNKPPSAAFSAYNTALSTIRWRHSPSDASKLQSNARILRWSDGSLTLQLASSPQTLYEIDGNPLAPPLRNPVKPTPVSVSAASSKGGRQGDGSIPGEKYDSAKDAFTYLVVPSESTSTLRVTQKVTAGLSLRQPESVQDDAIERLQAALANAANATKVNGVGSGQMELELIDEDPEKKRKEAEEAVRQMARQRKRQENAAMRDAERSNKMLGRSGLSSSRYGGGGLSASMLEDEEGGMGTTRGRKSGGGQKGPRRQRRNSIYSDDEDFGRKRFATKEDEYDEEDDFVAASDEEEEVEDDEDPDDGIVEEPREARRERTPKRDREAVADEDADADGEVEEVVEAAARVKRRRVVDEDEDDE